MDRIELTIADIESLLEWRDSHLDQVRTNPVPLKAVEIIIRENGYRIKGVRDKDTLQLYLNQEHRKIGKCILQLQDNQMWKVVKNKLSPNELQSVLTVYCSLMALMVYGQREFIREEVQKQPITKSEKKRISDKRSTKRVTYIIKKTKMGISVLPQYSHASPKGTFSVRGHYRHYKNGHVVWIAEYKKGEGKRKSKTYKPGKF